MFRFTIRDLVWLTVVVAVGAGWWVDHRNLAPDAELHRGQLKRLAEYVERMRLESGQSFSNQEPPGNENNDE
jgi:hypothetical protein